jgi:hypothetical protein
MKRLFALALTVVAWAALAGPAAAQNLSIKAFAGTWGGSAVANNRDSLYFGVTIRDLDVTIKPEGKNFRIAWTTVLRSGGTPEKPRVRKKSVEMTFLGTGRPHVWRLKGATDPLNGGTLGWARLAGRTLTVYFMAIDAQGKYTISRYQRRLSGSGMELEFTSIRDGEPTRTVRGKLVRHR